MLLKAPLAEPYTGPAILVNRATGVYFHEIFGHRIEGHRQKSETEGQTFAKKVNQKILPDFISVYRRPDIVGVQQANSCADITSTTIRVSKPRK